MIRLLRLFILLLLINVLFPEHLWACSGGPPPPTFFFNSPNHEAWLWYVLSVILGALGLVLRGKRKGRTVGALVLVVLLLLVNPIFTSTHYSSNGTCTYYSLEVIFIHLLFLSGFAVYETIRSLIIKSTQEVNSNSWTSILKRVTVSLTLFMVLQFVKEISQSTIPLAPAQGFHYFIFGR